jgi:T5SS/PEP-CTERM-associated repeat protein
MLGRLIRFRISFGLVLLTILSQEIQGFSQSTANWKASAGAWSIPSNWDCGQNFPNGCVPNSGTLARIGNGGTATLDINAATQSLYLNAGGLIVGQGLSLSSAYSQYIGGIGQGTLTIQGGGSVTGAFPCLIGVGGIGTATVTDANSIWSCPQFYVGDGTTGSLTVQNGGAVTGQVLIGTDNSSGTVDVTGVSSQINGAAMYVGFQTAQGNLTIQSGGKVTTTSESVIGTYGGAVGVATVTDPGSEWNNPNDMTLGVTVGLQGTGTLNVLNGGKFSAYQLNIGYNYLQPSTGSAGTVTVSDVGSQLNASLVNVGWSTPGTLTVKNGAVLTTSVVGVGIDAVGVVNITGVGSQWISNGIGIGERSQGTAMLSAGAVGRGGLFLGVSSDGVGTMTLTDAGTSWTVTGSTPVVGDQGKGVLNVQNGAVFSTINDLEIGAVYPTGGQGTLTVSRATVGANRVFVGNQGNLAIGPGGAGVTINTDLTVQSGGVLTLNIAGRTPDLISKLSIGRDGHCQGTIDVDFVNGFVPKAGDAFDLATIPGAGDFADCTFLIQGQVPGSMSSFRFSNGKLTLTFAGACSPSGQISLWVVSANAATGLVQINGVDPRRPTKTPFDWNWGDGITTSGWFPQSHVYRDTSKSYSVTLVSHEDDGTSDCANLAVTWGGSINVTTNLSAATFTITGPATFSGSGTSFTQNNAPAGAYTIQYGAVTGYASPASQTQTLSAGGTVTFLGTYQPCTFTLSSIGGDQQRGDVNTVLPNALVTQVATLNSSCSIAGIPITFAVSQEPSGIQTDAALSVTNTTTQANGTASTQLKLGDVPGQYQVTASCQHCASVTFTETACSLAINAITPNQAVDAVDINGDGIWDLVAQRPTLVKVTIDPGCLEDSLVVNSQLSFFNSANQEESQSSNSVLVGFIRNSSLSFFFTPSLPGRGKLVVSAAEFSISKELPVDVKSVRAIGYSYYQLNFLGPTPFCGPTAKNSMLLSEGMFPIGIDFSVAGCNEYVPTPSSFLPLIGWITDSQNLWLLSRLSNPRPEAVVAFVPSTWFALNFPWAINAVGVTPSGFPVAFVTDGYPYTSVHELGHVYGFLHNAVPLVSGYWVQNMEPITSGAYHRFQDHT